MTEIGTYFKHWHVFICWEKKWEEVFLTFLKDTVKQIINTWNYMMIVNQVNILCIWMQIVYIVGQWVNIFLTVNLYG